MIFWRGLRANEKHSHLFPDFHYLPLSPELSFNMTILHRLRTSQLCGPPYLSPVCLPINITVRVVGSRAWFPAAVDGVDNGVVHDRGIA